jgi:hypothetical protein
MVVIVDTLAIQLLRMASRACCQAYTLTPSPLALKPLVLEALVLKKANLHMVLEFTRVTPASLGVA